MSASDESERRPLFVVGDGEIDLIGPYRCPECRFVFGVDASSVVEHDNRQLVCPNCGTAVLLPEGVFDGKIRYVTWCAHCGPSQDLLGVAIPDRRTCTATVHLDGTIRLGDEVLAGVAVTQCSRCRQTRILQPLEVVVLMLSLTGSESVADLLRWTSRRLLEGE